MRPHGIPLTALAAGLLGAFPPAFAQEDEDLRMLTTPQSTVEAGVGYVDNDNLRFGMFNGLHEQGAYGLLGVDINRRDDATGTWLRFQGRNLGLESRDLRFEHERQGSWGYFIDFSQIPRISPYVVNTTLGGIDTTVQREGAVPARDVRLETRRDRIGLGGSMQFGSGFDGGVKVRNERKEGTRLWGQASGRFMVEPIDWETNQVDASVGFTGERLQLVAAYYGAAFQNANSFVDKLNAAGTPQAVTPVALPPDNQSHQLSFTGGYSFTPSTRATFKVAHGQIKQEERFSAGIAGALPGIPENLGGRIDTTLLQAGISSRPLPKLGLRADLRYEDRDDKTPVYVYTAPGATSTHDGRNEPRSFENVNGKAEASYLLPAGFTVTGGLEQENRKRNTSAVRSVSFRDETEETSYKLDLRRSLSDTINGAVTLVRSERTGSDWYVNTRNDGSVGSNLIHPLHLADRDRDKVRLTLDWVPTEPLSITLVAEGANDEYSGRTLGPREGKAEFYSIDLAYTFSEKWQAVAWTSRSDTRAEQSSCLGAAATPPAIPVPTNIGLTCPTTGGNGVWEARLRNVGEAVGLGLKGKPTGVLELGAEISYTKDRGEFQQVAITPGIITPAIPDAVYTSTRLKIDARYALTKRSGARLQYIYDRFEVDDWYWTGWVYADSGTPATTVRQDPVQQVHFIGATYYYQF
ncbi:MAG TPA: MtrB/PioB family decaheme-associated outer membrane protein [Burkholderiales bacterium]|nr:MtrB/PioB family decaheme-associated outer membrane protein [Burkholderiales bacterium]